nr:peptidoglycan-binding protein [Deltaproteobacteria bacterium]
MLSSVHPPRWLTLIAPVAYSTPGLGFHQMGDDVIRHRVQQGECLATIAHGHGFLWQTIYNAPENAELRRRRPNPNVLFPGDEIVIPERHPVTARVATGRQHTFKVPRQAWELRLRLRDHDHSAVAGIPWTLTVEGGGEPTMGTTGGDGLIAVPVASSARRAVLEVFGRQYSFEIGGLDPVSRVTGVQQRLVRLGYDPGAIDGVAGQRTRAAVRAFQASQEDLDDTGRID